VKTAGPALVRAAECLRKTLAPLAARRCEATVLNPLDYAWTNHRAYLERHGRAGVEGVLLGMNPGPWGMGQTGVPFGDPAHVRDFLGISGPVERPAGEHERCPILGLESPRAEVSGARLWGGVRRSFGTPERFFERFFVVNYCPLLFLNERGANVTPDKLPGSWMKPVLAACDEHLVAVARILEPRRMIGVGAWATKRIELALGEAGLALPVGTLLHPSPASPAANRGWLEAALRQLEALGCPWPEPSP
jgi:single-strand selective monofunctional uracil DNA glycosylase